MKVNFQKISVAGLEAIQARYHFFLKTEKNIFDDTALVY